MNVTVWEFYTDNEMYRIVAIDVSRAVALFQKLAPDDAMPTEIRHVGRAYCEGELSHVV